MGNLWLPDLDDWLRDIGGLNVDTWPGWLTRSRSSGGYDDILGICAHHDASSTTYTLASACKNGFETAEFAPVGMSRLNRGDGKWVIGAAGATNTQGVGGPMACSRGTIPADSGNRYVIAIEAMNNGVGEPWSLAQQKSYVTGIAAMIVGLRRQGAYNAATGRYQKIHLDPRRKGDIHAHFEWTTRKIDPAGPSQWADLADRYKRWKMDAFRNSVALEVDRLESSDMPSLFEPIDPQRHLDTRWQGFAALEPNKVYTLPKPEWVPENASALVLNITATNASGYGYIKAWAAGGAEPNSTVLNYEPGGGAICNMITVKCSGGSYALLALTKTDVVIDVFGYYVPV